MGIVAGLGVIAENVRAGEGSGGGRERFLLKSLHFFLAFISCLMRSKSRVVAGFSRSGLNAGEIRIASFNSRTCVVLGNAGMRSGSECIGDARDAVYSVCGLIGNPRGYGVLGTD